MFPRGHLIPAQSLVSGSRAPRRGQKPQDGPGAGRGCWKDVVATPRVPPAAFGLAPSLKPNSPLQHQPPVPASGFCLPSLGQLTRSPAPPRPCP